MSIIMRKGQELTCEAGHVIGVANRDIDDGKLLSDSFDWKFEAPERADAVCPTCGAPFIRLYRGAGPGYQPHTGAAGEAGWIDWRSKL